MSQTGLDTERPTRSEALRLLYWRSEILQVMFWLRTEGFGEEVERALLERFLGVDARVGVQHLDRLLKEGLVERVGERYRLTEAGACEGDLEFATSFDELITPTHSKCSPDSWCNDPAGDGR